MLDAAALHPVTGQAVGVLDVIVTTLATIVLAGLGFSEETGTKDGRLSDDEVPAGVILA